jgi:hypothetical protein
MAMTLPDYPDSKGSAGSVAAPGAGAVIAALLTVPEGIYEITVVSWEGGVIDALPTNMYLAHGVTIVGILLSTSQPVPGRFPRVTVHDGESVSINAAAAAGVGSIYNATLVATRVG